MGIDERFMRRAMELARLGEGYTRPNPLVGAVVVRDGEVIAEGYHARYGGPHAEAVALAQAGEGAKGADLYVNLEPCAHWGKTPPCADRIIAAGIRRVIVATRDPNPLVNGKGLEKLRAAGVEVVEGVLREEAERLNEVFFHWIRTKRPFVSLKLAMSLDGRIATKAGESRWITGQGARRRVHELRRAHAAVLVGVDTVLADDPQLTVREVEGPQPLRIVLDSRGRTPPGAKVLGKGAETLIATCTMPQGVEEALRACGARIERFPARAGRVDLAALLPWLGERGIDSLLVEGGGEVAWSFISAGLVQKLYLFYGPLIIGGQRAPSGVGGEGFARLADASRFRIAQVERLGEDLLVVAYPCRMQQNRGQV
ncbi:bifunctional diaminohydroxyphosphoribosylaminopyrimidine deaminase/5-amino-6-(5-phosphoribosylamino)uracil reductase RibD [Candidatus Bipolaricaulota bacterium]|nr:bifunctional diaminohydroxyphosphoribosylaminopyrimidine deaminase/5-amino-6-(5-phosphoribosylamino)uracil reductase RibD [Candidatus Bipolaricaulota bacterium]